MGVDKFDIFSSAGANATGWIFVWENFDGSHFCWKIWIDHVGPFIESRQKHPEKQLAFQNAKKWANRLQIHIHNLDTLERFYQ